MAKNIRLTFEMKCKKFSLILYLHISEFYYSESSLASLKSSTENMNLKILD